MSETYLYIFDHLDINGTDPFEYTFFNVTSLSQPLNLGFRFFVKDGTTTNINTGECTLAQFQNLDTDEIITYLVTDVSMEPYTIMTADFVLFKSWDEEKTLMKERFGFPTVELNEDSEYTTADFSSIIEDSISNFLDQGTSSELPVAIKFSKTNYANDNTITNIGDPKSITKNAAQTRGTFFNIRQQGASSGQNGSTSTSTGGSGMPTTGGY